MPGSTRLRLAVATAAIGGLPWLVAAPAAAVASSPVPAQPAGPDRAFHSRPDLAERAGRAPIHAATLRHRLTRLARKAPATSGYYVYDIDARRHRVLFGRRDSFRRELASNEKLFTTATALHTLGAESGIVTQVKAGGAVDARGRLAGDLYLVGGGDPTLDTAGLHELALEVKGAGIRVVDGNVVGDDAVFDRLRGVPDSNYGPSPYVAPLGGLVNDGSTYTEDPALATARAFRNELATAGVAVDGDAKRGIPTTSLASVAPIASHESASIADIVAATNKPSNNFYAEMLLKRLDATEDTQGTTRGGVADVERYAGSLGSGVSARDGSGLTDSNLASPRAIVSLLAAVRGESGVGDPLFDSLAIAGEDGTLIDRMGGTVAAGRCRGKTGTIAGVSNLSGYCRSGGDLIGFSLLMNGVANYDADRAIQDRMVVDIARYRR